jgi:pyridoxine 5-phosphate synthase
MIRLSVNIDHMATIRQARRGVEPDPVAAAVLAEMAGADGITCHLRGDRRHISDEDLRRLREVVSTKLNVEMAATREMLDIAKKLRPDLVTLVPEREGEVTTEGGIDAARMKAELTAHVRELSSAGIEVSLFVDPHPAQIDAAVEIGAGTVELNTNAYSIATTDAETEAALEQLGAAATLAAEAGLRVAAGHGLTWRNVGAIAAIPEIFELNIGHSIVARAALHGLETAIDEMKLGM